jgi:hypothetical protein
MGKVLSLGSRTPAPTAGQTRRAGRGVATIGETADRPRSKRRFTRQTRESVAKAPQRAANSREAIDAALSVALRNIAPGGHGGVGQGELALTGGTAATARRAADRLRAGDGADDAAPPGTAARSTSVKLRVTAMDWLRWWHGSTSDPKWRVVAAASGQPVSTVLAVWAVVLERASAAVPRGQIAGWDDRVAGAALDLAPAVVEAVIAGMQGLVLAGNQVVAWERRQPAREDNSAERTRAHRSRRSAASGSDAEPTPAARSMAGADDREARRRAWFTSIVEIGRTSLEPERFSRWVEAMTAGGPEAEPGGWAWKLAEDFDVRRKAERGSRRHG